MVYNVEESSKVLDGTLGGEIDFSDGIKHTSDYVQISVSGRSTGILTVTAKVVGSDVFEPFTPAVTINLENGDRTRLISGYVYQALNIVPDIAGDDFTVTICQWSG